MGDGATAGLPILSDSFEFREYSSSEIFFQNSKTWKACEIALRGSFLPQRGRDLSDRQNPDL